MPPRVGAGYLAGIQNSLAGLTTHRSPITEYGFTRYCGCITPRKSAVASSRRLRLSSCASAPWGRTKFKLSSYVCLLHATVGVCVCADSKAADVLSSDRAEKGTSSSRSLLAPLLSPVESQTKAETPHISSSRPANVHTAHAQCGHPVRPLPRHDSPSSGHAAGCHNLRGHLRRAAEALGGPHGVMWRSGIIHRLERE